MKKECRQCGKVFLARTPTAFCSEACREDYYTAVCPVCGKTFRKKQDRQRACSVRCGQQMKGSKRVENCAFCGKLFSTSTNAKFCSVRCREANAKAAKEAAVREKNARKAERIAKRVAEVAAAAKWTENTAKKPNFDRVMAYMLKHGVQYGKAYQAVSRGEE